jgi:ABC-type nitrate/sulfonate/bicarbonate transport system permease component
MTKTTETVKYGLFLAVWLGTVFGVIYGSIVTAQALTDEWLPALVLTIVICQLLVEAVTPTFRSVLELLAD